MKIYEISISDSSSDAKINVNFFNKILRAKISSSIRQIFKISSKLSKFKLYPFPKISFTSNLNVDGTKNLFQTITVQ